MSGRAMHKSSDIHGCATHRCENGVSRWGLSRRRGTTLTWNHPTTWTQTSHSFLCLPYLGRLFFADYLITPVTSHDTTFPEFVSVISPSSERSVEAFPCTFRDGKQIETSWTMDKLLYPELVFPPSARSILSQLLHTSHEEICMGNKEPRPKISAHICRLSKGHRGDMLGQTDYRQGTWIRPLSGSPSGHHGETTARRPSYERPPRRPTVDNKIGKSGRKDKLTRSVLSAPAKPRSVTCRGSEHAPLRDLPWSCPHRSACMAVRWRRWTEVTDRKCLSSSGSEIGKICNWACLQVKKQRSWQCTRGRHMKNGARIQPYPNSGSTSNMPEAHPRSRWSITTAAH